MQAQKAHLLLERILFIVIACTLVFAGLCIYNCLVCVCEGRWVSIRSSGSVLGVQTNSHGYCTSHRQLKGGPLLHHHASPMPNGWHLSNHSCSGGNSSPTFRSCCLFQCQCLHQETTTLPRGRSSSSCRGKDMPPASCILISPQLQSSSRWSSRSRRSMNRRRRSYTRCGAVGVNMASAFW